MLNILRYIRSLELIDYIFFLGAKKKWIINPKLDGLPKNILFLCKGNICRSAYADKKFSHIFNHPDINISSAGLDTVDGKPADYQAIENAKLRKINLSSHRTRCASVDILNQADLILIMDSNNYKMIDKAYHDKVKYLGCFARERKRISIKDPFGKSEQIFEICFEQIDKSLEGLKQELKLHTNLKVHDSKVDTMIFN